MGIIVPIIAAFVLGYLMFFARLKGVYVAILMLVVSLLFETFLNQTAGPGWYIGEAHLGGNNGLGRFSGVTREAPSLIFSFSESTIEFVGSSIQFYYLCFGLALITFLALRLLVNSSFGYKMIAIREDIDRTEALGHNIKLIQLIVFCVGAGLASMSGILYVSWGNFITPDIFGVYNNILPVIWVAVAGRKSLSAAILGSFFISWISQWLNEQGDYALIALGAILLSSMLLAPEGVIVKITQKFSVK
jgi:branched-chain amino acid transport system permease protein